MSAGTQERHCYTFVRLAGMAELADALDLGSSAERRAGSSPVPGTNCFHLLFDSSLESPPQGKHYQRK